MKAELKKINTELLRLKLLKTARGHIINTCPLRLGEYQCKQQEELDKCKNVKQEADICSTCWVEWLIKECEV